MVNTVKNVLITLHNLQQMHLKLLQKKLFRKQQKQLLMSMVIKLLIELQMSQEVHYRINQTQLQQNTTKYLKKDIYHRKNRKLLMT